MQPHGPVRGQTLVGIDAGIVDQDVEPAKGGEGGFDAVLDVFVEFDIAGDEAAVLTQLVGQGLAGSPAAPHQHDLGTGSQ
ncbi:hypothetical protein D3C80_1976160 [compost metagenome]